MMKRTATIIALAIVGFVASSASAQDHYRGGSHHAGSHHGAQGNYRNPRFPSQPGYDYANGRRRTDGVYSGNGGFGVYGVNGGNGFGIQQNVQFYSVNPYGYGGNPYGYGGFGYGVPAYGNCRGGYPYYGAPNWGGGGIYIHREIHLGR